MAASAPGAAGSPSRRVVIAGGGVAALEALLALSTLAGERVSIELLAPERDFTLRPRAVLEPFRLGHVRQYPLGKIVAERGARYRTDSVARVDSGAEQAVTNQGDRVPYDALVVAVGARSVPALAGATTFAGAEDADELISILREIEQRKTRHVAFVVPADVGWTLPLYELALMTALHAKQHGVTDAVLTLITPEDAPLGVFGNRASEAVASLLDRHGIRMRTASYVESIADREVTLRPAGERIEVDRVIALPRLEGPRIAGLPCDESGFIPTDEHARVRGADDVYAAGDAVKFPVKQGGLATQQADAAAEMIAAQAGAPVEPNPFRPMLRGVLLAHAEPQYLRSAISGGEGETSIASSHALWWPSAKVAGRYLAPYLAELDARTHGAILSDVPGAVRVDTELKDLGGELRP